MIMEKYGTCCWGSKACNATCYLLSSEILAVGYIICNIWLDESFYLKRGDHMDTKLTSHNFLDVGHQFRYDYV